MDKKPKKKDVDVDFDINGSVVFKSGAAYINSLTIKGDVNFPLIVLGDGDAEEEFDDDFLWDDDDEDSDDECGGDFGDFIYGGDPEN